MRVSNMNKYSLCERNRTYLEIIYTFGNKVMLLKQLYQYTELLGLAKNYSSFYSSIKELVNAEVLRKEPFVAYGKKTQLQMLTLQKFAIRFLECKENSYSVASVPKTGGNERILVSLFKNCYIIKKVIPRIQREFGEVTFNRILEILDRDYSTVLLNKNQGISFLSELINHDKFQHLLDFEEVKHALRIMKDVKQKQMEGLKKGSVRSEGKGVGKINATSFFPLADLAVSYHAKVKKDLTKEEKLDNYNIDNMLSFNAYIAQVKLIKDKINVTVLILDIHNRDNIYRMGTHIACMYNMFNRYFNSEFLLKIGIVSIDEFASKNLKAQAETTVRDFVTKEEKGTRLSSILRDW